MKGDNIPNQDHISRLCFRKYITDGEIQAGAFMLKSIEESLSVNWLEYLNCPDRISEIDELRNIIAGKLTVKRGEQIAVLNVGEVCDKVQNESPDKRNLEVLHNPRELDESHSEVKNLKHDDELIAELILQAVRERYPAIM